MPTIAQVRQAMQQLEQAGTPVSIESVRSLIGGSPRDLAPLLRQLRGQPEAPVVRAPAAPQPPPLTLAMLRDAARQCVLMRLDPHPLSTLDVLNRDLPVRYAVRDVWHALAPEVTDQADMAAVTWKLRTVAGEMVWSRGEGRRLDQIWQRLIVGAIGRISAKERDQWAMQEFARQAQARRQAEELARRRQVQ